MDFFFSFNNNFDVCLEDEFVKLIPLQQKHFHDLFFVASDKRIWEQHPNPNRYQQTDFEVFFKGAIASDNAFLIIEKATNTVMGCSRFYGYDATAKSVFIGYTFLGRTFWGKGFNQKVKHLMMQHAFNKVDKILFHVGSYNVRSQIAMERLGAQKIGEELVEYFGEKPKMNFVYVVLKPE